MVHKGCNGQGLLKRPVRVSVGGILSMRGRGREKCVGLLLLLAGFEVFLNVDDVQRLPLQHTI